jgi:hypothetical protein
VNRLPRALLALAAVPALLLTGAVPAAAVTAAAAPAVAKAPVDDAYEARIVTLVNAERAAAGRTYGTQDFLRL